MFRSRLVFRNVSQSPRNESRQAISVRDAIEVDRSFADALVRRT
jgi:hypothetical protein